MKHILTLMAVLTTNVVVVTGVLAQNKQVDAKSQAQLTADLRSQDAHRVNEALVYLLPYIYSDGEFHIDNNDSRLPRDISDSFIWALENQNEQYRRMDMDKSYDIPYEELRSVLVSIVVTLEDPASIPALMPVAGNGNVPMEGLMIFGRDRVYPIALEYAMSPERTAAEVSGSLDVLSEIVERWSLDSHMRAEIKQAALLHLNGPPDYFVSRRDRYAAILAAINLSFALGDSDLKDIVSELATNEEAWHLRGIPELTPYSIRWAQDALDNWSPQSETLNR